MTRHDRLRVADLQLSPQGSSLQFAKNLQEPLHYDFQSHVHGYHALMVGLKHLDQPRQTESKTSGSLEGISINQRPLLGLNQLTVSLIEPSGLTSLSRFDSLSSLFDLRREPGFGRP